MNWEIPDVQAGFRKCRGLRDQIANISWIIEKAREFQKYIYLCSMTTLKSLILWNITNNGKLLKDGNTRPPYLPPEKSMHDKKQLEELDMEQQTGSK